MQITGRSLRKWAIRCFLGAWTLFFLGVLVPIVTLLAQKHANLEGAADSIWKVAIVMTYWATAPWFVWIISGAMGLVTGFAAGVWLDAIVRRREEGLSFSRSRFSIDIERINAATVTEDRNSTYLALAVTLTNRGSPSIARNYSLRVLVPERKEQAALFAPLSLKYGGLHFVGDAPYDVEYTAALESKTENTEVVGTARGVALFVLRGVDKEELMNPRTAYRFSVEDKDGLVTSCTTTVQLLRERSVTGRPVLAP